MSLRERWRRGHGSGDAGGGATDDNPSGDGTPTGLGRRAGGTGPSGDGPPAASRGHVDITDFDPHTDGDYHCAERGLYLRFARPIVTETLAQPDPSAAASASPGGPGRTEPEPARGEFTASGRFTVQQRFSRPVVYTILEVRSRFPIHAQSFLARRTDTADGSSADLEFVLEPDDPDR